MLQPSQGMIQRLKRELVYALALSHNSQRCLPGENMMELLSVAETRIIVGGGGAGGVIVLERKLER